METAKNRKTFLRAKNIFTAANVYTIISFRFRARYGTTKYFYVFKTHISL